MLVSFKVVSQLSGVNEMPHIEALGWTKAGELLVILSESTYVHHSYEPLPYHCHMCSREALCVGEYISIHVISSKFWGYGPMSPC